MRHFAITAIGLAATIMLCGAETSKILMTADYWATEGNAQFVQKDGFTALELKPGDAELKLSTGRAVLKDVIFRNGTIQYDVETNASMGAGFVFRRRDKDTYEEFYLRPQPNCAAAPDCVQYAPGTHGVLLWDLFPQYQSPAPLKDGWNHVKLVVSDGRMNVFINGLKSPTLKIGHLEGDALEGGLQFDGPGVFANLTVTPGAVEGLPAKPEEDPTDADRRYLRTWKMSGFSLLANDHEPSISDLPAGDAGWHDVSAERAGLVNISREYGLPLERPRRAVVWLKTTITSKEEQTKKVQAGWNRELWVFVNGKQVFADKNLYQPPAARKSPDGRCSLENGSFSLPLKAGKNEIVAAVADNFYGWALILRLDDMNNIHMAGR